MVPPDVLVGVAGVVLGNEPLSNVYWHPRFHIAIPGPVLEELTLVLYPFLPRLRAAVASITDAGRISPGGVLATLEEYAVVLIQVCMWIELCVQHGAPYAPLQLMAMFTCPLSFPQDSIDLYYEQPDSMDEVLALLSLKQGFLDLALEYCSNYSSFQPPRSMLQRAQMTEDIQLKLLATLNEFTSRFNASSERFDSSAADAELAPPPSYPLLPPSYLPHPPPPTAPGAQKQLLAAFSKREQLGLRVAAAAGDKSRSDEIKRAPGVKGPRPFPTLGQMQNMGQVCDLSSSPLSDTIPPPLQYMIVIGSPM